MIAYEVKIETCSGKELCSAMYDDRGVYETIVQAATAVTELFDENYSHLSQNEIDDIICITINQVDVAPERFETGE